MRAAVSTAGEPWLELTELPDPEPGPDELVLRVEACGICGSDLHMAQNGYSGVVFGHEFAGTVVAVGAEAGAYGEGDRVVGFPLVGCGACDHCAAGRIAKCRRSKLIGAARPGAYSEYVSVRAADAFALPEQVSSDLGALVEPLAVAHHALERTPREPGEPVLVLGAGPVGLAVALWARLLGARDVVVSDPMPARRELAKLVGAEAVDPGIDDVARAFADLTGARPSTIVECVGRPGMAQHASDVAAGDGHITFVGACSQPDTFLPMTATMKELSMQFVVYYRRRDFAQTLAFLADGRLDPAPLVTARIPLDDLPGRFGALMGPNADCKVLVHPGGGA